MNVAKLSVSLDPNKIKFIEQFQISHKVRTKSEVVDRALALLQHEELKLQYVAAYQEWQDSGEQPVWDAVTNDGLELEPDWNFPSEKTTRVASSGTAQAINHKPDSLVSKPKKNQVEK